MQKDKVRTNIYCCINVIFKTTNIYYLAASMKFHLLCQSELQLSEATAEGFASKLTPMVVGRPVLLHMGLPRSCLNAPTTWQPASPRESQSRKSYQKMEPQRQSHKFMSLHLRNDSIFHILWSHRPTLYQACCARV